MAGWPCACSAGLPRYDKDRRELWAGDTFVLGLASQATSQGAILAALEATAWDDSVDSPLDDVDLPGGARCHRDAVFHLNEDQPYFTFFSESDPPRVRWRVRPQTDRGEAAGTPATAEGKAGKKHPAQKAAAGARRGTKRTPHAPHERKRKIDGDESQE